MVELVEVLAGDGLDSQVRKTIANGLDSQG